MQHEKMQINAYGFSQSEKKIFIVHLCSYLRQHEKYIYI